MKKASYFNILINTGCSNNLAVKMYFYNRSENLRVCTFVPVLSTIVILLLATAPIFGQSTDDNNSGVSRQNIAPDVDALLKQAQQSVDLFTGSVNMTIPLFELVQGPIKVPIQLSYNNNGIKLNQSPTWVGLGWELSAGGAIVRELHGSLDETSAGYSNLLKQSTSLYRLEDNLLNSVGDSPKPDSKIFNEYFSRMRPQYLGSGSDGEPDVFHFNVMGRRGRIMFDGYGNILSDANVKASAVIEQQKITSWTLIFDDGLKFVFNLSDNIGDSGSGFSTLGSPVSIDPGFTRMMWHLTEVFSPGNNDHIRFEYEKSLRRAESYSFSEKLWIQTTSDNTCINRNPIKNYGTMTMRFLENDFKLKKIVGSSYEIIFDQEIITPQQFEMRAVLKQIEIRAGKQLVNTFNFSYKPYGSRYLLSSVQERGADGKILPPYKFFYNEQAYPWFNPYAQYPNFAGIDHWGYYNGPQQNYTTQIPSNDVSSLVHGKLVAIDRRPSFSHMKAGILERFENPLGGSVEFTYGQNDYSYLGNGSRKPENVAAGGLRIEKVVQKSNAQDEGVATTYQYLDEQGLSSGITRNDPYYQLRFELPSNAHYEKSWGQVWRNVPLEDIQIRYRNVQVFSGGGRTEYAFSTEIEHPHPGRSDEETFLFVNLIRKSTMTFQRFNHPFRSAALDQFPLWGTIKSKSIFDKANLLLYHEQFEYEYHPVNKFIGRTLFGIDSYEMGACGDNFPATLWFFHKYYYHLGNVRTRNQTVQWRDKSGGVMAQSKSYKYSPLNSLVCQIEENTSTGDLRRTEIKYPLDYTRHKDPIALLQDANIVNVPIEEWTTINGNVAEHFINEYTTTGKLFKQNKLQTPTAPIKFEFNPAGPIITDNFFLQSTYNYGEKDRLVSATSLPGFLTTSYGWDPTGTYIISECTNANTSDYFHTSFEDGTGNSANGDAVTGQKSKFDGMTKILTGLSIGPYVLTYWKYENGWQFHTEEVLVDHPNHELQIFGKIDEVRLYPKSAMLRTYTYKPGVGITSSTDENNISTFYEYDAHGRVAYIRDHEKNVIKAYSYGYKLSTN